MSKLDLNALNELPKVDRILALAETNAELEKLDAFCEKHNIFVIADEIHNDLVFSGEHIVYGNVSEHAKMNCIICTAPSKTFNLAGLVGSYPDNGLMLSIVAGNDISGVFVYAILFSILQSGSTGMQLDTGVPSEFTTMLIAITVLSVVAFRAYANTFINKMIARRKILKLEEGAK
mgnify:CR=1 FL=1